MQQGARTWLMPGSIRSCDLRQSFGSAVVKSVVKPINLGVSIYMLRSTTRGGDDRLPSLKNSPKDKL